MTSEPSIEAAAAQATKGGTASLSTPHRIRIRWGWFLACIVLGLAAITAGWFLVAPASRLGYVGGVFAGIGTTLLLVGIVVLLERRIVDTAVKVVQDATKEARDRADEEVRAQMRDFEDRVAGVWQTADPEDASKQTRRMIDEFSRRVADAYTDDDAAPSRNRSGERDPARGSGEEESKI